MGIIIDVILFVFTSLFSAVFDLLFNSVFCVITIPCIIAFAVFVLYCIYEMIFGWTYKQIKGKRMVISILFIL